MRDMKTAGFVGVTIFLMFLIAGVGDARADVEYPIIINAENFPDEHFRAWILKQSYGLDGELSRPEIAMITSIRVINQKVSDLTGIELFTALKELSCRSNQLTTLDLSKNTALKELRCSDNQLTALDLSKNTALESLLCDGNKLTTLDLSKNTALKNLFCSYNQLTTINVSKNTALEYLYCFDNQLTSLNLSKNTALKELFCFNNKLTTLDVSKNTVLEYLGCSRNQLTTLDVSKNTALTGLDCSENQLTILDLSNNTALTILDCNSNQLTTLDLSKNIALKNLFCSNNQLTTIDVSKNAAMEYLLCSNNQLTTIDVSKNAALEYLFCSNNQLTTIDVSKNAALKELDCDGNQLPEDELQKSNPVRKRFKNPDPEFARAVSNEAFPVDTRFFYTYILIGIYPDFEPESQILIRLKVGEQHAQASFRQANITFDNAFQADDSGDVKTVVELMKIQKKDITIPKDVVSKWLSDFWDNLAAAAYQMRDKDPNVITLHGTQYSIEVYTKQNKITLSITGGDLSGKYDDYDIASMLEWIAPIVKYVKDAIPDKDDKK